MTLAEREQRYRKFGASPYIGEPNVKESAGGLRDMHTAMWLGAAKFGARTLRELADKGLITPREQAGADAALTFLWRVRNELHFFSGHKNDVLTRDLQPRDRQEPRLRERRRHASASSASCATTTCTRACIHRMSRRLIARCQETLSRRGVGRAAAAPAGAGRRARVLRRPRSTWPTAIPTPLRTRPDPAHEGLLAPAPAGLRAVARPGAGDRGLARRRSTTPSGAQPGRPRRVPRHLPRVGPGGADAVGDARAGRARPLPAGVRRADLPGAVRRLSQVLGRPALAAGRRAPGGAGPRPVGGIRGRRPGLPRGGEAGAADAGHAAARHRQGQGPRPRGQGHSARSAR